MGTQKRMRLGFADVRVGGVRRPTGVSALRPRERLSLGHRNDRESFVERSPRVSALRARQRMSVRPVTLRRVVDAREDVRGGPRGPDASAPTRPSTREKRTNAQTNDAKIVSERKENDVEGVAADEFLAVYARTLRVDRLARVSVRG